MFTYLFSLAISTLAPRYIEGSISPAGLAGVSGSLKYLGSSTSPTNRSSRYYLSKNAAGWSTAQSDCVAFLGKNAHLLFIETKDELDNLNRLLKEDKRVGSSYWTGGLYDKEDDAFMWGHSRKFESWVPWDAGHPNTKTRVTRVYLYWNGEKYLKLRTQFTTVSTRYICELQMPRKCSRCKCKCKGSS